MVRSVLLLASVMGAAPLPAPPTPHLEVRESLPAPLQVACGEGLLGDVTADGSVTLGDAQQIARAVVGLSVNATVESRLSTHGDVTGDGSVTLGDAQQIARWSVGLSTSFAIGEPLPACEGIRVTTTTTGDDLDADGYEVQVDGILEGTIGVNGVLDMPDAELGDHTVTLQGLASNCAITNGGATRSVTVVEGEAAFVDYEVECTATGGGGNTLDVRNTTSGGGSPPGGSYTVTLDGGSPVSMDVDGSVAFQDVAGGAHTVTLGNLGTCTVDGGATKTVDVESGLNILHFSVECPGE